MRGLYRNGSDGHRPAASTVSSDTPTSVAGGPAPAGQAPADFFASLAVLGRRWKVLVVGLGATFALAFLAVTAIPATYKANGTSFLSVAANTSAPTNPGEVAQVKNPYLAFGGSLNATAELMASAMNGEQDQDKVVALGGTGTYVVDLAPGDAPVLTISATGKTPEEALTTQRMATQVLQDDLKSKQEAAKAKDDLIQTIENRVPVHASKQQTSRIRGLIGVLVLGFGATIMAAFVFESIAQHRARGRVPRPVEREGEVRPLAGRRGDPPDSKAEQDEALERLKSLLERE